MNGARHYPRVIVAVIVLSLSTAAFAQDEQAKEKADERPWGDLTGRLIFDGKAPAPAAIGPAAGPVITDESLVVNSENAGIANVLVHLKAEPGRAVAVHPAYDKDEVAKGDITLTILGRRLNPHAVLLRTSQTLVMLNADEVACNPKFTSFLNPVANPLLKPSDSAKLSFDQAETTPMVVTDNIHPWMKGYIAVTEHPYAALSDFDGNFKIQNLPVGLWTIQFWHERAGFVREVKRGGKPESWPKGRITLLIQPGQNDLGEILVPKKLF